MAGQGLNYGDLFVKIEVFPISEPIAVKVLKLATCNFHERVPWTIIYGMACIWGICAVIIAAYRLGSLKVRSAARHWRWLVGRCRLGKFTVACNAVKMKLRYLKWTWYLPFMWHQMNVSSHIICPNVSISLQTGQILTHCEQILRRKFHTFIGLWQKHRLDSTF